MLNEILKEEANMHGDRLQIVNVAHLKDLQNGLFDWAKGLPRNLKAIIDMA